ncbi:MAG: SMC-Scp complex subunit ScpB [Anaerolineaceae bacterium]|nr:SMC-Scp complex subunit ScpB [Anaerolineaceae bacterium]
MTDQMHLNDEISLEVYLEALLFVASLQVSITQLAEVLNKKPAEIEAGLHSLEATLEKRGLCIMWHEGRVQLTTSPELAPVVEKLLGLETTSRLSRPALETLSIIAYKQPITRPGIDVIRGVNSDGVLKNLLRKGLIKEVGRVDGPGRPILYGTTADFLRHFGISSLEEMPRLDSSDDDSMSIAKNGILKD